MTNFIYNMQDELFHLNMILPVGEFSPIMKLVDHIEAQGKQLRELNAAITKKNVTIEKCGREKESLQKSNSNLIKKVDELNNGIRDPEDLSWKQKYDALLHGSEQAIAALQKKCQEYKHSEDDATISAIETLSETNKKLEESNKRLKNRRDELIRQCDELYMANEEFNEKYEDLEKNRDELLAERDALRNENNELKEEVNLYIGLCTTKHEEVEALAKAVRCPLGNNAEIISVKTARIKELEEKNKKLERANGTRDCYISELENEIAGLKKELNFWKTDDKRSFFGKSFDMHSIYDLNRLEEIIANKIKSYDSKIYSLMAERNKYKESSEEYRLKLMVAERQRDEHIKADKILSKINDLIHGKE